MAHPTLIVYCGLPGVGKSAASAYTAADLSAERFRSDEIRKQLFSDPSYTAEETAATYEELLERARDALESGSDVVLDATFSTKRYRDLAAEVALEAGADVVFTRVQCDVDVVERRLAERTGSISDAGIEEYWAVRDAYEPIERTHLVVDNSGSLEETYRQVDRSVLPEVRD